MRSLNRQTSVEAKPILHLFFLIGSSGDDLVKESKRQWVEGESVKQLGKYVFEQMNNYLELSRERNELLYQILKYLYFCSHDQVTQILLVYICTV